MKANTPTPTTLRKIIHYELCEVSNSKDVDDAVKAIQEQLKALLPEKRLPELLGGEVIVYDDMNRVSVDELLKVSNNGFNQAIDQIQKAIEEWAK